MSFYLKFTIGAIFTLGFLLGCQSNAAPPTISKAPIQSTPAAVPQQDAHQHDPASEKQIPRIALAEAKKEFDAGTAVFVDSRDINSFKFKRIKGAINMPPQTAQMDLKQIPSGKKIIVYCS